MANENTNDARLAVLLMAYGSDVTRWPVAERDRMAELSAGEREKALRDDVAIDQLLRTYRDEADRAPASAALMAKIMAAIPAPGDIQGAAADKSAAAVVPFRQGVAKPPVAVLSSVGQWRAAAALMAASLVLGLFIGSTAPGQATARSIGELAGIGFPASPIQTSGLDDAFSVNDDEDIL